MKNVETPGHGFSRAGEGTILDLGFKPLIFCHSG
jgi:hypothetical protein